MLPIVVVVYGSAAPNLTARLPYAVPPSLVYQRPPCLYLRGDHGRMVPDMAAPTESLEVVGVIMSGSGFPVPVMYFEPAIPAAPLAPPPVPIKHGPAEPRPSVSRHPRLPPSPIPWHDGSAFIGVGRPRGRYMDAAR